MIPINICFSKAMKAKIQGLGQNVRIAFESLEDYIEAQDKKIEQLQKENAELKANGIIQDNIIQDNHNPIDQDKIIKLILENKELKSKLEKSAKLPCKVGDKVYIIEENSINQYIISNIDIKIAMAGILVEYGVTTYSSCVWFLKDVIGKTVFLSRQEAKQALKGGNDNEY